MAKSDDKKKSATDTDDKSADDAPLGEGGERALKAERDARRKAESDLKAARDELATVKADQDSSKSDLEKVLAKVEGLETRAADAERKALVAEIAQAKGLTAAQARRLQGSTRDEMESDADDLLEAFGGAKPGAAEGGDGGNSGDDKGGGGDGKPTSTGKPKEDLRPGAAGGAEVDDVDPDKIAESILKSPF